MSETQVLARKWRPKVFPELTGQEHVVRALANALESKRLHHAYLFTGTRGVGKTTLARILAKALNCTAGVTPTPCGACTACVEIDGGRFVDLIELDAASNTQVDSMRELLENALYAPTSGRYKVYIIDEAHMLSRSAFNAMLKTLEEPPEHVKFILATTDPQKIPVTVLSRCLQFNLKRIPWELIAARLRYILEQEAIAFDPPALALIARAAQGSLRDALSLLDQAIAHGAGKVGEEAVRDMLGVLDQGYLFSLLAALNARDGARLLAIADHMEARSLSFDAALQDLASLLTQVALAQMAPEALAEDLPERSEILALARAFGPEEIQLFYQIAVNGRSDLSLAPDEYAGFTMTLLRMLAFAPETETSNRELRVKDQGPEPGSKAANHKAMSSTSAQALHPLSSEPEIQSSAPGFGDDWRTLVGQLKLTGMAKMLASHCELKRYDGERMELVVPEAHKHLLEKSYQERLMAALIEYFGRAVKVKFSVGNGTGMTPAELENRERQARQARAIAAIEQDPFVRELVEQFDARLIDSSIKPVE